MTDRDGQIEEQCEELHEYLRSKLNRNWRLETWRDKHGKIVKKNDHYPDALLCTMEKWWNKARRKVTYTKVSRRRGK